MESGDESQETGESRRQNAEAAQSCRGEILSQKWSRNKLNALHVSGKMNSFVFSVWGRSCDLASHSF